MKLAGIGISVFAATLAALVLLIVFTGGTGAPGDEAAIIPSAVPSPVEPTPTPLPTTWLAALDEPSGAPPVLLISCLDANGDGALTADDGLPLAAGAVISLDPALACVDPARHADFYPGVPFSPEARACDGPRPVQILLAASAGSDLLQPREGESLGLITIAKTLRAAIEAQGGEASIMVAMSAIFGADPPQTSMEAWVAGQARALLDGVPCARVILIGHSHGGVTVTAAAAALEARYAERMLVVIIDRTAVLYDRVPDEMPQQARVLNFFQLNEGWHGEPIDQPNVENIDESDARAPIAPSDGGGGLAIVSHKTLDDAVAVQQQTVDAAAAWALR